MEGVMVLTAEIIEKPAPWTETVGWISAGMAILGILMLLISLITDNEYILIVGVAAMILAGITGISAAIAGSYITVPDYTQYEVIIEDTVSMKDFTNKYEILDQRGEIYVVKEIEK